MKRLFKVRYTETYEIETWADNETEAELEAEKQFNPKCIEANTERTVQLDQDKYYDYPEYNTSEENYETDPERDC